MKIDAAARIVIVAGLCALGLVALVVREGLARASGTEVVMRMEAVDPRSLLSGHYVVVSLRETAPQCPPGTSDDPPADGWVALRPDGDRRVAGMAGSRDEAAKLAPITVRGHATCAGEVVTTWIGVERFYIDQAGAKRIEDVMRGQDQGESRVSAIISAGLDGKARLEGLVVDGERIELRWF